MFKLLQQLNYQMKNNNSHYEQQKNVLLNQINQLKSQNTRLTNEVKVLNRNVISLNNLVKNQNNKNKMHKKQLSSERLEQSSQSFSIIESLNKGMQYIIERYQTDIKQLIFRLKNPNRYEQDVVFKSESKILFQQLWNEIVELRKMKKKQKLLTQQKSIQMEVKESQSQKKIEIIKLIKKYEQSKLENDNNIKLIVNLIEITQRLSYNNQVEKYKNSFLKSMIQQFCELNFVLFKKIKHAKLKKIVISIKFIIRLKKQTKSTLKKLENVNLQLIQNKILYSQIYKSYANNFEPVITEKQVRKSISKLSSEKTLTRLLNLQYILPKKNVYVEKLNINLIYWKNMIKMAHEYDIIANRLINLNKFMEIQENKLLLQQQCYQKQLKQKDYQLQKSSNIIRILKKRLDQQKIKH